MRLPATDNHMHLDPERGVGTEAVLRFAKKGGSAVFIVVKPRSGVPSGDTLIENNLNTLRLSERAQRESGVRCYTVLGVHPVEVHRMVSAMGAEKAVEHALRATEHAAEQVEQGSACALGEYGYPHYPVEPEVIEACDRVLLHAFELARDAGCAVQLHTPAMDEELRQRILSIAEQAGVSVSKLVKHFSPPEFSSIASAGLVPSVIATKKNIRRAVEAGSSFMMESDYIDELSRPGAVVSPEAVPKVTAALLSTGELSEELAWRIHVEVPEKTYGVEVAP
ncbi:MAG: hypothetical protein GXN98_01100 [Euryarchaeota archaeon]|nr:hypothetical protein [Euryarchaeota archaeon]